jgi:hypothetical protein
LDFGFWIGGELKMKTCQNCKLRAQYDRNPRSILGRLWKWHIGWCPGWKSYLNSLPAEQKEKIVDGYGK